jgi:NAD(P)-dependent dehydrogenase (short-subunit alcohol dehydrogenase family)
LTKNLQVVEEIRALDRNAISAYANVALRSEVEAMVEASVQALGPLNVMVANAGIVKVQWLLDSTEEDWRRVFDVNVFGMVNCNIVAAKQMIKQENGGKILNAARCVRTAGFLIIILSVFLRVSIAELLFALHSCYHPTPQRRLLFVVSLKHLL